MPEVSFVIPTWAGDAYLAETIESCRQQSLKDIEIIVVDDASPDFTEDLMSWYLKGKWGLVKNKEFKEYLDGIISNPWTKRDFLIPEPRIKYHKLEQNGGVCNARNYGNKVASSELICVLDHDDLSDPWRAKFCVEYFKKYPETQCLTGAYYEANADGIPVRKFEPKGISKQLLVDGKYLDQEWWQMEDERGWLHSSACYRKSDILRIPYREMEGETDDYRFLIDWLEAGMIFKATKKVLAYKRMGPDREMNRRAVAQGGEANVRL